MANTWPGGYRHAMTQSEHEQWNAIHYPGTRQMCERCGEETGQCEEDAFYGEDGFGPLCVDCFRGSPAAENIACERCGRKDLPLHIDMKCPDCSRIQ